MYFGTLKAIFKAFYASFYFYNNKATFVKRISSAFYITYIDLMINHLVFGYRFLDVLVLAESCV